MRLPRRDRCRRALASLRTTRKGASGQGGLLPAVTRTRTSCYQTFDTSLAPRASSIRQNYSITLSYPLYARQNSEVFEQARARGDARRVPVRVGAAPPDPGACPSLPSTCSPRRTPWTRSGAVSALSASSSRPAKRVRGRHPRHHGPAGGAVRFDLIGRAGIRGEQRPRRQARGAGRS